MHPKSWGALSLAVLCPALFIQVDCDVIIERADSRRPYRIYEDQPARFGNALPSDGLVGLVIPADPIHGCRPPAPAPNITLPKNVYFISLIQRSIPGSQEGECTFQEKVENAQKSGYSGAIVYNYLDDELIPMGGDADVLIPSVFVGKTDGLRIRTMFAFPSVKYFVKITENPPFDINSYLLPFAVVVGICFLIMFGIMVFKCIQDRRRERRHRLPKSSLRKIPTKKFSAEDESRYETCCICLEDYVHGDKLRILPCDHAYHMKCIDPWLLKNKRVCPQCRKKVFANGEVPPSDSESETEDERAPLLARPRLTQGGTFSTQNENPFRRAARRLARRGDTVSTGQSGGRGGNTAGTSQSGGESSSAGRPPVANLNFARRNEISVRSVSPGGRSTDSSSTEGGGYEHPTQNNQLVTQVYIEQPSRMPTSPTPTPSSPIPPANPQSPRSSPPPPATTGLTIPDTTESAVSTAAENSCSSDPTHSVTEDNVEGSVTVVDVEEDYGAESSEDAPLIQSSDTTETEQTVRNEDPIV